jgi:hypothetical protein
MAKVFRNSDRNAGANQRMNRDVRDRSPICKLHPPESRRRAPQADKQAVRIAADPFPGDGHPEHAPHEGHDKNPGDCAADFYLGFNVGFTPHLLSCDVGVSRLRAEVTAGFFARGSRAAALRTILDAMINRLRRVQLTDPTRSLTAWTRKKKGRVYLLHDAGSCTGADSGAEDDRGR